MAKNLEARCRLCRRAGSKLFLKGERCSSVKCAVLKRKYPPGVHGPKRQGKISEYGLHLKEKQKLKRYYNVSELQLKNYFKKASKKVGDSGKLLLRFLERRFDNAVYRAGFASSRSAARQLINHSHFLVNGKRNNIPSYQVKVGDTIVLKGKSDKVKESFEKNLKEKELPKWLAVDKEKMEIKIIGEILDEDLQKDFDINLVIEFYSK